MNPFPSLPPLLAREIAAKIRRGLPPPHEDTPASVEARDALAFATVAALQPGNALEALLAVRVVIADAHALDSLAAANESRADAPAALRCRNWSLAMMRQTQQAMRLLLRAQAERAAARPAVAAPAAVGPGPRPDHETPGLAPRLAPAMPAAAPTMPAAKPTKPIANPAKPTAAPAMPAAERAKPAAAPAKPAAPSARPTAALATPPAVSPAAAAAPPVRATANPPTRPHPPSLTPTVAALLGSTSALSWGPATTRPSISRAA
jgi:hypothetical protein